MEFSSNKAIYLQICTYCCEKIIKKLWLEEERIPSVRELSSILEVNANTVMRAYDSMQENSIIYNKRGIGYFVSTNALKIIDRMYRNHFFDQELIAIFAKMEFLKISIDEINTEYTKYKQNLIK